MPNFDILTILLLVIIVIAIILIVTSMIVATLGIVFVTKKYKKLVQN